MAKIHNIHAREIAAPVEVVGEILDTLGSADDRVWATDIWVAEPVVFDRPLAVGAAGGHGSIRYSVVEYQPGRRVVFRFSPGGGLSGTHSFELEPVGSDHTRITHFLDAQTSPWIRPLAPILIGWHDAMVETAFDRVEVEATGSLQRRTPVPLWLRIANRTEIATARALGKLPPRGERAGARGRRKPVYGADRVARAWVALRRKAIEPDATPIELNGRLGLLIAGADGDRSVLAFVVDRGRIARIDVVRNPEKLRRVARAAMDGGHV